MRTALLESQKATTTEQPKGQIFLVRVPQSLFLSLTNLNTNFKCLLIAKIVKEFSKYEAKENKNKSISKNLIQFLLLRFLMWPKGAMKENHCKNPSDPRKVLLLKIVSALGELPL